MNGLPLAAFLDFFLFLTEQDLQGILKTDNFHKICLILTKILLFGDGTDYAPFW